MTKRTVTFSIATKIGGKIYPAGTHDLPTDLVDALESADATGVAVATVAQDTNELQAELAALKSRLDIVSQAREIADKTVVELEAQVRELTAELDELKVKAAEKPEDTKPNPAKGGKTA